MKSEPVRTPEPSPVEAPYPSIKYAWYVVAVLTFVYVFSFIDRQILNLLVKPIRRDLGISDTQMSLLMGLAFALFYTICGIPLGRLADRNSRRGMIAIGFVLWSIMTACCGLAQNFIQMLAARIGVGVGEAALSPSAYSLISDYFPKEKRATAISIYSMGIYIGSGLAFLLGGIVVSLAEKQQAWNLPIVGATRPWQVIFFIVGLPGVLLALLMFTIREPLRRGLKMIKTADGSMQKVEVPFSEVAKYIGANWKTFLCHTSRVFAVVIFIVRCFGVDSYDVSPQSRLDFSKSRDRVRVNSRNIFYARSSYGRMDCRSNDSTRVSGFDDARRLSGGRIVVPFWNVISDSFESRIWQFYC